jgi:hypothetical protein
MALQSLEENVSAIRYPPQDFSLTLAFVCNGYGGRQLVEIHSNITYSVLHEAAFHNAALME